MTDPSFTVYLDDLDVRMLDFWPAPIPGIRGFDRPDALQAPLDRVGGVLLGAGGLPRSRTFTLSGSLICASAAQAASRWHELKGLLAGMVTLRVEPEPELAIRVRAQKATDTPKGTMLSGWEASVELLAPDPYWYARRPDLYWLVPGVRVAVRPGSATSPICFVVFGTAGDGATLMLYDAYGTPVQSMELTGVLSATEAWEVDGLGWQIDRVSGSSRSPEPSALANGHFLSLPGLHGPLSADGPWPTLVQTGADRVLAIVRRAYL